MCYLFRGSCHQGQNGRAAYGKARRGVADVMRARRLASTRPRQSGRQRRLAGRLGIRIVAHGRPLAIPTTIVPSLPNSISLQSTLILMISERPRLPGYRRVRELRGAALGPGRRSKDLPTPLAGGIASPPCGPLIMWPARHGRRCSGIMRFGT